MSESKQGETGRTAKAKARRAREAEALRANLIRRKALAGAPKRAEEAENAEKKPDWNRS
jgi:hypothetical protein